MGRVLFSGPTLFEHDTALGKSMSSHMQLSLGAFNVRSYPRFVLPRQALDGTRHSEIKPWMCRGTEQTVRAAAGTLVCPSKVPLARQGMTLRL
jgi:hypothetical protein